MAKIKRKSVSQVKETARTARAYAADPNRFNNSEYVLKETAMNLARGRKKGIEKIPLIGTRYANQAELKAARMMQKQRAAETTRTANRAEFVTKKAKARAEKAKTTRALTGGARKAAPKAKKKK
jgi:hypothetical protein